MAGWIILGVVVLVGFFFVSIYNRLVAGRNAYKNAFAQIDVQLTRRHDLIPNLVETAKGYMKHERETLEAVISARNAAVSGLKNAAANPGDPNAVQQLAGAENVLTGALGGLALPGSEGEPKHDAALRGAHLDGEQSGIRTPGIQRRRDDLQQFARDVPEQHRREQFFLPAGAIARNRSTGETGGTAGEVLVR